MRHRELKHTQKSLQLQSHVRNTRGFQRNRNNRICTQICKINQSNYGSLKVQKSACLASILGIYARSILKTIRTQNPFFAQENSVFCSSPFFCRLGKAHYIMEINLHWSKEMLKLGFKIDSLAPQSMYFLTMYLQYLIVLRVYSLGEMVDLGTSTIMAYNFKIFSKGYQKIRMTAFCKM